VEIFDQRGERIQLSDQAFVAEGGEGRIYALGDRIYKIYHHPDRCPAAAKFRQLQRLDHPNLVRPLTLLSHAAGHPIGIAMARVPERAVALPRLFSSTFWGAHGLTVVGIARLVEAMRATIEFIHRHDCLQVDGNEFNYLVDLAALRPWFIDVDSYQTPGFPATAIMPSIRDYSRSSFSQESDWYSFAVIAFQLFTGIHPFKGRHPDFAPNDFAGRMAAGISVFHPAVSYPSSVRDFALIPSAYRQWFERLFIHGERIAPPRGVRPLPAPGQLSPTVASGGALELHPIARYDRPLRRWYSVGDEWVVELEGEVWVGRCRYQAPADYAGVVLNGQGQPRFPLLRDGRLTLVAGESGAEWGTDLAADRLWVAANLLFVLQGDHLIEVQLFEPGGRLLAGPGSVRKVLPHATRPFDGLLLADLLGRTHLLLPVARGVLPMVAIPELDGERVVEARYRRGVAGLLMVDRAGHYRQARIRFSSDFSRYDFELREEEDLNFAVLAHGVVASIPRDGLLELTSTQPASGVVRWVEDGQIRTLMRLAEGAGQLRFQLGQALYAVRLKA